MNRSSSTMMSPGYSQRYDDRDIFSNSLLFGDRSAKASSPRQSSSMQFSDSMSRYSNRKAFESSPAMERRLVEPPRSLSKPGLPPVSSSILDEGDASRSVDLSTRLRALRGHDEPEYSSIDTPLKLSDVASAAGPGTGTGGRLHSPLLDLRSSLPVNRLDALWSSWIVIFGFDPSQSTASILQRFQQHGDIVHHRGGAGNWLFVRFSSPIQAERAAASRLVYLSSTSLAGVQVMTAQLAQQMNVTLGSDGWIATSEGVQADGEEAGAGSYLTAPDELLLRRHRRQPERTGAPSEAAEEGEGEGLYIRPKRRKSICERIIDYFWAY